MAYMGFNALKSKLATGGGVRNPGAVAASIGRKKYGASAMSKAASSGTSLRGRRPLSAAPPSPMSRG